MPSRGRPASHELRLAEPRLPPACLTGPPALSGSAADRGGRAWVASRMGGKGKRAGGGCASKQQPKSVPAQAPSAAWPVRWVGPPPLGRWVWRALLHVRMCAAKACAIATTWQDNRTTRHAAPYPLQSNAGSDPRGLCGRTARTRGGRGLQGARGPRQPRLHNVLHQRGVPGPAAVRPAYGAGAQQPHRHLRQPGSPLTRGRSGPHCSHPDAPAGRGAEVRGLAPWVGPGLWGCWASWREGTFLDASCMPRDDAHHPRG